MTWSKAVKKVREFETYAARKIIKTVSINQKKQF